MQVVRIGDSMPAPAFKLVAQPNDWGKQVKAATSAGESSEKGRLYSDFWDQLLARIHSEHPTWTRARTSTRASWLDLTLVPGAVLESSFTRVGLSAWIYFGAPEESANLARFQELAAVREQFESALGAAATWDEMSRRKATRIGLMSAFSSVTDTKQWPQMIDWLLDVQARLRAALNAVGGVPAPRVVPVSDV